MIQVPARVKDALKSGDYKKNVKITVENGGIVSEHKYEEPEIDISLFEGPMGDFWTASEIEMDIADYVEYVEITIDSIVPVFGWDDEFYIAYQADPDIFDFDYENNTTTITMVEGFRDLHIHGRHIIPNESIQSNTEFTYVKVSGCVDNVIQNDKLVSESLKFDERMCSDTELKFGLCEGTSVEFQYFDFPNIRGQQINIELEIQYKDEHGELMWYPIPMGWYEVKECSRQASTGIIKATAYNKLQSNYLDQDVLSEVYEYVYAGTNHTRKIVDILNYLLNGFHIEKTDWDEVECQLCCATTPANGINCGMNWNRIYYKPVGGSWAEYERSGYSGEYPYDFPNGNRWVIYAADFYYKPSDDTGSSSTNHYYKFDDLQIKQIWDIVKENLYIFYDYEEGGYLYNVVTRPTDPTIFMPSQAPHFSVTNMELLDYAINSAGDDDPDNRISGFFGNVSWETGTSVAGHNGPINYSEFTGDYPCLRVPLAVVVQHDDYVGIMPPNPYNIQAVWNVILQKYTAVYQALCNVALPKMYKKRLSSIEEETITADEVNALSNLTLRDLQSAVFEVDCQYGKLDRVTDLFAGIELNQGMLFPRDDLYPADDLFPQGTAEAGYPAMYSKLWADEGNVRSFRYLYVTYKTTENNETVEKVMQKTVNANGTDDYIMDDNWLFKNIVWSTADVSAYADAMVAKMQNIRWFPFEMWCAGLPYLESGDMIEIKMKGGTYPSYVLRRVLNGIQNLQDEMINGTLDIF